MRNEPLTHKTKVRGDHTLSQPLLKKHWS